MDIAQVFADFLNRNGFPTALMAFICWFFVARVWPWLTKEFWPTLGRREEQRNEILRALSAAVLKLESVEAQGAALLRAIYDFSSDTNRRVQESQVSILELIRGLNDLRTNQGNQRIEQFHKLSKGKDSNDGQ